MEEFLNTWLVEQLHVDSSLSPLLAAVLVWAPPVLVVGVFVGVLYFTKTFNDHITYTGNGLAWNTRDKYRLQLRSFPQLPIGDLLPSNLAFRLGLAFALLRVKKKDPFVRMRARDMDVLQPNIINGLSGLYPEGLLAWQIGAPYREVQLLIAVSYEKYDDAKSRKMRVIIATEDLLAMVLLPEVRNEISFERTHQRNRLETLVMMAKHWQREQLLSPDAFRIVRSVSVYLPA